MATKKVFCSHRGADKPAVEAFARQLREKGIDASWTSGKSFPATTSSPEWKRVFPRRSAVRSVFTTGPGGNPVILWGVLLEVTLILIIAYTRWGSQLFGTGPLYLDVWLLLLPLAAGMIAPGELRKYFARSQLARREI